MFIRSIFLISLLAGCSSAHSKVVLDPLISFEDSYNCLGSKQFSALLESALVFDELPEPDNANDILRGRLGELAVPAEFRSRFGKPKLKVNQGTYTAEIPVEGIWHGAQLNTLIVIQTIESEGGFYLVFDDSRQRVMEAAKEAGFALPESGTAYRDADVMGVTIQVGEYAGKSALSCFNV